MDQTRMVFLIPHDRCHEAFRGETTLPGDTSDDPRHKVLGLVGKDLARKLSIAVDRNAELGEANNIFYVTDEGFAYSCLPRIQNDGVGPDFNLTDLIERPSDVPDNFYGVSYRHSEGDETFANYARKHCGDRIIVAYEEGQRERCLATFDRTKGFDHIFLADPIQ